ncbi:hypothetical protein P886_2345 [Alteromonadaceae bacterium 2753L.S.0a.02]|nr:hypothetical protein P886_2345 [Alteromonadaceae bacterium 2753L.S.0a.02]
MLVSIRYTFLVLVFLFTLSCSNENFGGCNSDSPTMKYLESLSQARLEELYNELKRYSSAEDARNRVLRDESSMPREFLDLQFLRIDFKDARILVAGCFDNFVYLKFHGLGLYKTESPAIYVTYGEEYEGHLSKLLWPLEKTLNKKSQ